MGEADHLGGEVQADLLGDAPFEGSAHHAGATTDVEHDRVSVDATRLGVGAEKVLVTGSKKDIFERYGGRRKLGGTRGKGPYYPRYPDQLMKRTVRGMLPYKKATGKDAYDRLKVYMGIPKELENEEMEVPEKKDLNRRSPVMALGVLSKELGAKM